MFRVGFSQSTYIYDPPGTFTGFTNVNNWDLSTDDTMHPSNFTDNDQIFSIEVTSQDVELDGDWTVSGTNSKVVVGDGLSSTVFTIPENFSYTGTIDVAASSTLNVTNNIVPTMGTLSSTSTVVYNESVGASNQIIAAGTYGNLTIRQSTPIKELQTSIDVTGDLTFNDTEFTVTSSSTITLDGDLSLLQTVVFNSNLGTNLSLTHNGSSVQNFTAANAITIPLNSFSSTKSGGSLTLGSTIDLDITNNFTMSYTSGATFNVTTDNSATVGGTYTLSGSGDNDIMGGDIQSLTINLSSGNGILQGAATVNGTLTLTSGSIELGDNDLTVSSGGSISGAGASKYIITNDDPSSGGELFMTVPDFGAKVFPIGTPTSYNPLRILSLDGDVIISARVFSGVYNSGTSGALVDQIDELVNRTWSLNTVSSPLQVNVRFQWNESEEGVDFLRADGVKIAQYSGGEWTEVTTPTTPSSGTVANSYYVSQTFTSFSEFALGDAGSTLPVIWLSFTGEEVHKGIASLKWKTASELNNEGFEIQKSLDGKNFEVIGFVEGAGTTNEIQTYGFTDEHLQQNTYYRLRQIDFDGKFDYSRIIFVESSLHIAHPFRVYPNPIGDATSIHLTYQLTEPNKVQPLQLQLHDMWGSLLLIFNGSIDELNDVLNDHLSGLSQGVYLLTLSDFTTFTHLKILKQ